MEISTEPSINNADDERQDSQNHSMSMEDQISDSTPRSQMPQGITEESGSKKDDPISIYYF